MTGKTGGNAAKIRSVKVVPKPEPDKDQRRVADRLIEHIDLQIQSYLNGWQTQALGALMAAQQPPEDGSKVFWYIALGGNLLWAGTCLVNPAGGAVVGMSFFGAAIGSEGSSRFGRILLKSQLTPKHLQVAGSRKSAMRWRRLSRKRAGSGRPTLLDSMVSVERPNRRLIWSTPTFGRICSHASRTMTINIPLSTGYALKTLKQC